MSFQWWCVAGSQPWSWTWQPYVGVWLFLAVLAWAYRAGLERLDAAPSKGEVGWFAGGLVCLWAGLDWPLAALGASHLASAHAAQFLLVGVAAPALLLLGVPEEAYRALAGRSRLGGLVRRVTHPVWAFLIFNSGMIATHWPEVTDTLMASVAGSFFLDMVWIACGVVFWWPLMAAWPERPGFHPLLKMAYLALNALLIRPPFLMMVFSEYPIYATYELAPPFPGTTTVHDQQFAGAVMKLGTAWIMGAALAVEFIRWARREKDAEREGREGEAPA